MTGMASEVLMAGSRAFDDVRNALPTIMRDGLMSVVVVYELPDVMQQMLPEPAPVAEAQSPAQDEAGELRKHGRAIARFWADYRAGHPDAVLLNDMLVEARIPRTDTVDHNGFRAYHKLRQILADHGEDITRETLELAAFGTAIHGDVVPDGYLLGGLSTAIASIWPHCDQLRMGRAVASIMRERDNTAHRYGWPHTQPLAIAERLLAIYNG